MQPNFAVLVTSERGDECQHPPTAPSRWRTAATCLITAVAAAALNWALATAAISLAERRECAALAARSGVSPRRQQLLMFGTMHAATTSLSRLICDVDPSCTFFFEPDARVRGDSPVGRCDYRRFEALLRCDADAFVTWEALGELSWEDGPSCDALGCHCSASWEHCTGAGANACILLGLSQKRS